MASVKMTGQEYNEFTAAEWGPGWYWDETVFLHNGVEVYDIGTCDPADEVVIVGGTIYKSDGPMPPSIDALPFARKWLKARTVTTIMVEVPKDQVDAFKADMKARQYRVLPA